MRQLKITQNITNRESASLEKYFQDVNKVEMITPEMEVELAKRIQDGDQLALEKLVKANLRFVVSVAKQYQNRSLSLNDLINEGNLGLIKAAQKFDHTRPAAAGRCRLREPGRAHPLRLRRGGHRPDPHARGAPGPGRGTGPAGCRDQSARHPDDAGGRAPRPGGDRFDPDHVGRSRGFGPRLGEPGPRHGA